MASVPVNQTGLKKDGTLDKRLKGPIGLKTVMEVKESKEFKNNGLGRPMKTVFDLPEDWIEIMDELGKAGGSKVELKSKLRISDDGLMSLVARDLVFSEHYQNYMDDSAAWWEACGRKLSDGTYPQGKPAAWCFVMSNRFGMRSKTEISGDPDRPLKTEITDKTLSKEDLIEELKRRGLPTSIFGNGNS